MSSDEINQRVTDWWYIYSALVGRDSELAPSTLALVAAALVDHPQQSERE